MDDSQAFIADTQSPELMKPGMGTLYDPSGLAEEIVCATASSGNIGGDAFFVRLLPMAVVIIAPVGLHNDWFV